MKEFSSYVVYVDESGDHGLVPLHSKLKENVKPKELDLSAVASVIRLWRQ